MAQGEGAARRALAALEERLYHDIGVELKGAQGALASVLMRRMREAAAEAEAVAWRVFVGHVSWLNDEQVAARATLEGREGEAWAQLLKAHAESLRRAKLAAAGRTHLEAEEQSEVAHEEASWRQKDCEDEAEEWKDIMGRCAREAAVLMQWITMTRCANVALGPRCILGILHLSCGAKRSIAGTDKGDTPPSARLTSFDKAALQELQKPMRSEARDCGFFFLYFASGTPRVAALLGWWMYIDGGSEDVPRDTLNHLSLSVEARHDCITA